MSQLIDPNRDHRISTALAEPSPSDAAPAGFVARLVKNLAFQDLFITVYLTVMLYAVVQAKGDGRANAIQTVLFDAALFTLGITLTRGGVLKHGSLANNLVYRLTVFFPVFFSYFQLRSILPVVSPHSLDADLLAFDLRVFGVEPAIAWDKYVTPHTTEWFAFFYFLYFFLLCAHVLPMLFNASSRSRLAHFALGAMMIAGIGQILYMIVPGWGPYHHLAGTFENPLEGDLFWRLVQATVAAGGSQKDIFPSLHTAVPTYFAIFSFMHRRTFPFKITWPFMAFTATQIIIATMFLRWHYLIDIIAGLTLAFSAAFSSGWITAWETERRRRIGAEPIFSLLEWPRSKPHGSAGD